MKGRSHVQSISWGHPADLDHRIAAAAELVYRGPRFTELSRGDDEPALSRAIRRRGFSLFARPGDGRSRHLYRWRRAFRRADQRHELAELSADAHGRLLDSGGAERLSTRHWRS